MYQAINKYFILEKSEADTKTTSGIIVESNNVSRYTVVEPAQDYSDLKGKTIIARSEDFVITLPDKQHYAIHIDNVVAVEK